MEGEDESGGGFWKEDDENKGVGTWAGVLVDRRLKP